MRVKGRINATDRDGRITSDVKLLAETVETISDETLSSYTSTGTKLAAPVIASSNGRRKRGRTSAERVYNDGSRLPKETTGLKDTPRVLKEPPKDPRKDRLYILVEDPSDVKILSTIRRLADIYLGVQEVILVLKEGESKRPLKMPFRVDISEELLLKLRDLVGNDKVRVC